MNAENIIVCKSLREAISLFFDKDVKIENRQRVIGGDANDAYALLLSDERRAFLKENALSNADFFRAEAEGIAAVSATRTLRVPQIYAYGKDGDRSFLLMEFIRTIRKYEGF